MPKYKNQNIFTKSKKFPINNSTETSTKRKKRKLLKADKGNPKKKKHKKDVIDVHKKEDFIDVNNLDWSEITCPESVFIGGDDDMGGFLCLEEINDVDVEYEETPTKGNTIRFKKATSNKPTTKKNKNPPAKPHEPLPIEELSKFHDLDTFDEQLMLKSQQPYLDTAFTSHSEVSEQDEDEDSNLQIGNEDIDSSAWKEFNLSSTIMNGLKALKFESPTPIQEKTLHAGLNGRDVIGKAETGSGKTLAFGIPILEYIVKQKKKSSEKQLVALILTPTRELAIQIKNHLQNVGKFATINIMTVVGGMAIQKQKRLLEKNPNIIVGTPGRLWELFSENDEYLNALRHTRFLVLDEADRMLEAGHFKELSYILSKLSRNRHEQDDKIIQYDAKDFPKRQTFIFSATLDNNLKSDINRKKTLNGTLNSQGTIAELMNRIEFRDSNPLYMDITPKGSIVETLQESKIDCLVREKDLYMYYFITRYPGRTLVFVNSIDAIRRLIPIMRLLNIEVFGLHAQMQQRQRLKNLDRFKQNPNAVMVASDVAARGLDIPLVEHVIHYQLPRSGDIYIHRSGRTARARNEGISLMLCSPEESSFYRKICQDLKKANGIANFPIDGGVINSMKQRIDLARRIDQEEHKLQKGNHDDEWFKKVAEDLEVDLDDELLFNKKETNKGRQNNYGAKYKIQTLKLQLKELLSQPLVPRGVSTKYLTSGIVRDLADRLLNSSSCNSKILGMQKSKATEDLKLKKNYKKTSLKK
ncbi:P-loop containing nucleoside triphosphate hydrolase protein [Gigaspora margarita]|uniref:RNA helicase n=1 Tax=Gigaspora margarita TaxID=4874 RepID=A0A8H3XJ64_GIGMA|nr:P-loop containing nucleoside triphosphate hydrolase protein [Gigaspora margarita]